MDTVGRFDRRHLIRGNQRVSSAMPAREDSEALGLVRRGSEAGLGNAAGADWFGGWPEECQPDRSGGRKACRRTVASGCCLVTGRPTPHTRLRGSAWQVPAACCRTTTWGCGVLRSWRRLWRAGGLRELPGGAIASRSDQPTACCWPVGLRAQLILPWTGREREAQNTQRQRCRQEGHKEVARGKGLRIQSCRRRQACHYGRATRWTE